MREYVIKSGDSFFYLAQQNGCCCQDLIEINQGVDPCNLQIGQKIKLPSAELSKQSQSAGGCAEILGKGHSGRCDDVIMDVEGVKFRVTRVGEASVPHEIHLIVPRTEIRKVEYPGSGVIETSIMISNINIINSPRHKGEGSVIIEQNGKQH